MALADNSTLLPADVLALAKSASIKHKFHPDLKPAPPTTRDPVLWDIYEKELGDWEDHKQAMFDAIIDHWDEETLDKEQLEKDYNSGRWGQLGYKTPRRPSANATLYGAQLQILEGEINPTIEPTLGDAKATYLKIQAQTKPRTERKERKFVNDVERVCNVIEAGFNGPQTLLTNLTRARVREVVWQAWPTAATRNRYINQLNSILNTWNQENENKVFNPFSGLTNKNLERKTATDRLPFTPKQWEQYRDILIDYPNREVGLIGLIMLYTGCRTEDASGLQVRDVKLRTDIPYLVFRDNGIRTLAKNDLDRAVPIVEELYTLLTSYDAPLGPSEAFFPRYGTQNGATNSSALLMKIVRETMGIKDKRIVAYSTRHTIHDMLDAAHVPLRQQHYLTGHKTPGSSQVHDAYGTKMPPKFLLESLQTAVRMQDWGYFDEE
ncbi:MAG: hypothetical protein EBR73_06740 [Rhodobacteraceae bacterium]|nr:hypothetical protein [Paracoccaceae bacterium]